MLILLDVVSAVPYVFCRNWALRNPAGTMLDSSLVNKLVASSGPIGLKIGHRCEFLPEIAHTKSQLPSYINLRYINLSPLAI